MLLPDRHYLASVGQLRYTQATYERGGLRNPDRHVAKLLSPAERIYADLNGKLRLDIIRRRPFYAYLLARTKFYDDFFRTQLPPRCKNLINIGAGTDTRAHRFREFLDSADIDLLECDLDAAIERKRARARRAWTAGRIHYQAIDLNATSWPRLEAWLKARRDGGCRVMMEGVSPYIEISRFPAFLKFLAHSLSLGCRVAYDFKVAGANDALGRSVNVREGFRLPRDRAAIAAFHQGLGFAVRQLVFSDELTRQTIAAAELPSSTVFDQDGLVVLRASLQDGRA
jgi:O-methyltransferase involved in polyketide biosynthesis